MLHESLFRNFASVVAIDCPASGLSWYRSIYGSAYHCQYIMTDAFQGHNIDLFFSCKANFSCKENRSNGWADFDCSRKSKWVPELWLKIMTSINEDMNQEKIHC